ncbi:MAG: GerAB/ArcD/ProY family transporter [Mycobacterium leprae]
MEGQIGLAQGTLLVFAILSAKLFVQYPGFLIDSAGPAAWQTALIMTGVGMLLFLPTALLVRRFPRQSLASIAVEVAGPILGRVLTLLVGLWLFAAATLTVRAFTETFIISILPTTPPSVLTMAILLCVIYASWRGFEPLCRANQVLFPLMVGGIILVLLFSLPRADMNRLFPIWGKGIDQTVMNGLLYGGMAAEALVLPVLGYAFADPETLRNSGLNGILLFGLSATATVAVLVTIFGAPDAAEQSFPMFNLARLVYLGRFLQRIESLVVMFWFFAAAVRLSALFHAGIVIVTQTLNLPWYRPLLYPMALLVGVISLMPKDFVTVLRLDRVWLRPSGIGLLLVPLLLLFIARFRRKGGEGVESQA